MAQRQRISPPSPAGTRRRPAVPARPPVPAPQAPLPPPPPEAPTPPARRRQVRVGLAAEASAQAAQAGRGGRVPDRALPAGRAGAPVPARQTGSAMVPVGTCRCGLPAGSTCAGGCGHPTCSEHLLNRASRLSWPGPYRSEREHTAYLQAFWAGAAPRCSWCREAAGAAALDRLPPVAPLPGDVLERLAVLRRNPHDYPRDAWEQTVRRNGGSAAVARLLAARVSTRRSPQEFDGRRKGETLAGVSVGGCSGTDAVYEVMDRAGAVWTVRPLGTGLLRKRRAWSWEQTPEDRLARLLPGILELASL